MGYFLVPSWTPLDEIPFWPLHEKFEVPLLLACDGGTNQSEKGTHIRGNFLRVHEFWLARTSFDQKLQSKRLLTPQTFVSFIISVSLRPGFQPHTAHSYRTDRNAKKRERETKRKGETAWHGVGRIYRRVVATVSGEPGRFPATRGRFRSDPAAARSRRKRKRSEASSQENENDDSR